jgi:hypothetical protein
MSAFTLGNSKSGCDVGFASRRAEAVASLDEKADSKAAWQSASQPGLILSNRLHPFPA